MKIPLAEHFHSIQGEGYYTGVPMHFVRLAGCNVGKHTQFVGDVPDFPDGHDAFECVRHDGVPFWCDTDFNKHESVELQELIDETHEHHICLTGGEPLASPLICQMFSQVCTKRGIKLHIETSGTKPLSDQLEEECWITVCPKEGWRPEVVEKADEIKLLVDEKGLGDITALQQCIFTDRVYLSPINGLTVPSNSNLQVCLDLLKVRPEWRLSVQLHKYLGVK